MAAFYKSAASRKYNDTLPRRREKGRTSSSENTSDFFETSRIIEGGLFFLFAAAVISICFLGQQPKGPRIIVDQPAPARVVADFAFNYTSQVDAEKVARATRAQVPPVFQRTFQPYEAFRQFISELNRGIAKNQIDFESEGPEVLKTELTNTAQALLEKSQLAIAPELIVDLNAQITPKERSALFEEALNVLKAIYEDGVYAVGSAEGSGSQVTMIQLQDESGRDTLPNARSLEDALVVLRVRINALSRDKQTARSLYEIFRAGLTSNLRYSATATNRAIEVALSKIEPPIIAVAEGETLIEPGAIATERAIEKVDAYRQEELKRGSRSLIFNKLFLERTLLTALLLIAVFIYLKQGLRETHKRNRAIAITAVSILLNLLVIRAIMEIGEVALAENRPWLSILPYITPYAIAPIIIAILVGTAPAVLSALIVSVLFGIIQGNSIEFQLIAFISGVTGSYFSANIRKRSKLVRAGLVAGGTAAVAGAMIAALNNFSPGLIGQQIVLTLIVGALTGIVSVGVLPIFEQAFKITTEITLLELTDFNHPLLRRMQIEAPGTYHHSLMVANLSENAAARIGASPLLCRVACFFHDIGKLVKPEYFTENQQDGINPHDQKNPSMSALVIKAHVKEGVELARKHKLPRVIVDVIRQHHGTGLIQFFYYQAQQIQDDGQTTLPFESKTGRGREKKKVDESTYRYDGPKPAFKESAIILFADSVEAASRSLKKVTQPAVEELIDNIFRARIEDGQLDECPLTFQELNQIRNSFVYTILNMLHARVEYPKSEKEQERADKKAQANGSRDGSPDNPSDQDENDTTRNQQRV